MLSYDIGIDLERSVCVCISDIKEVRFVGLPGNRGYIVDKMLIFAKEWPWSGFVDVVTGKEGNY